jgi:two-component system chemotaxis response regulator CheY
MAKILVTDDAAFMRMTIKNALARLGEHEIDEATNGQEAVDKCEINIYDLVMLDITMPELDGIGALRAIKNMHPNAKVVMCSAMGQESMVVEAIKLGALDFIVKPFKPDRIAKTLSGLGLI